MLTLRYCSLVSNVGFTTISCIGIGFTKPVSEASDEMN